MKKYSYKYDRQRALRPLVSLSHQNEAVKDDMIRTRELINALFDEYEDPRKLEQTDFAFIIPTRASRFSEEYWEEVYDYFPAYRHIKHTEAFISLSSIPPFRIEMYGAKGKPSSGVLVFAPIFSDMMHDYKNKILLTRRVRKKINETVDFAKKRFGVRYVGLGATLPRLTNYGKTIKPDVVTTTGHAGTVWLLKKVVLEVLTRKNNSKDELTVGFIGGGAIGLATMQVLAKELPQAKFIMYDKRPLVNKKNQKLMEKQAKTVEIAATNKDLLQKSQIIVSAVTSTISVDGIDLSGKVIVDDSQPGSFQREKVFAAGGELIWVVGEDASKGSIATRRQGYSYGSHGLYSSTNLWGCEAEIATIAYTGKSHLALNRPVEVVDVENIGELFEQIGITTASFQSHGQINP